MRQRSCVRDCADGQEVPGRPQAGICRDRPPPWLTQTGPVAGSAVKSHLPRLPSRRDDLPTSGAAWQRHATSDPKRKIETTIPRRCSHLSLDKDAYKQLNWKQITFPLRRLLPGASLLAGGRELTRRTSGQRACVVLSTESSLSTHQLRSRDSCPPPPPSPRKLRPASHPLAEEMQTRCRTEIMAEAPQRPSCPL